MTAIVRNERDAWLARRREIVTASDCAAILGFDPRRGPLAVYAEKIGELESPDNEWMAWGRDVEEAIGKGYERKTGRPAFDLGAHEIALHPDAPWLGATLDRQTAGSAENPAPAGWNPAPLELKALAGISKRAFEEEPPAQYQIQLQVQIACTRAEWGSLCALIGGLAIAWKDILRHDAFLAKAMPILEEFHWRVQRREAPPADGKPGTSDALRVLYADEDGDTVRLDDEAAGFVQKWQEAKYLATQAKNEADAAENALRARLGHATFGRLPDGSLLSLKTTCNPGFTVAPYRYRQLRRSWPRLMRSRA